MAKNYVKFPTKFFETKEWSKPRKYSKAEALLYLLRQDGDISVRHLATAWQWSRTGVERFIKELKQQKMWDTFWDTFRDTKRIENERVAENFGTQSGTPFGTHLNKDNNNPPDILSTTNVVSNISFPPKGESDFLQSLDFEYQDIVRDWLSYKRERKESYKSIRSMQAFFAKLKNLSQGSPAIAREIINQSMANNWAGIFPLKIQDNEKSTNTRRAGDASPDELLRAVAEGISRANTPQEWQNRVINL